jgi:hypothetical protein
MGTGGGDRRVAARVDRFTESCHVIDVDPDSWRQKRK